MHWTLLLMTAPIAAQNAPIDCVPPDRVSVLPVLLVPDGEPNPTAEQTDTLLRHLQWTQERYREMLHGRGTFQIADREPLVLEGKHTLEHYRTLPQGGAPQFVSEALDALGQNRFSTPHVFLIVLMNPAGGFPTAGGRPLNGGYNTGGGMMMIGSRGLDDGRNFQSTLQHELGHAFGLLHSNAYGFDQKTHTSVMSYNPTHHTRGFEPSETPGILGPEDITALALNRRIFPDLTFDPAQDVPEGYPMPEGVKWLGPQEIPGQVSYKLLATTGSGETNGSTVGSMLLTPVAPSAGPGITFDPHTMWHSGEATEGWVQAEVTFPVEVRLSKVIAHTQHSGEHHAARALRIEAKSGDEWLEVAESELPTVDCAVTFTPTAATEWRFHFQAGPSNLIVIRGLRFFSGDAEVFPPLVPVLEWSQARTADVHRRTVMPTLDGIDFTYEPTVIWRADEQWTQAREPVLRRMPDDSLLCLHYSGGPTEPHDENVVLVTHSQDDGDTWSAPELLFDHPVRGVWSTELFTDAGDPCIFLHTFCAASHYLELQAFRSFSRDNGRTWSEPESLPTGARSLTVRQGIVLSDGAWLFPVYWQEGRTPWRWEADDDVRRVQRGWRFCSGALRSTDGGETFSLHGRLAVEGQLWEPNAVEVSPGHVVMVMRAHIPGSFVLYRSDSHDGGLTWSPAQPTDIPNAYTKPTLLKVGDAVLLLNNPNPAPGWDDRTPLSLWVSRDGCETWPVKLDLAHNPSGAICYPHGFADMERETLYIACDTSRAHYLLRVPFADFLAP